MTVTTASVMRSNDTVGFAGCRSASATATATNFLGWSLYSITIGIENWCTVFNLYGYWIIYSQP